jgi:hypothetical protein
MPKYLLLMYLPGEQDQWRRRAAAGETAPDLPSPDEFAAEGERWNALIRDLKDAGVYLANQGLAGVEAATTVRVRDGDTQITDGPFAETKELLAGYILIQTEDLDAALTWAARVPTAGYGAVEVRPVWA